MIKWLLSTGYVSPAQARWIELFVIWTIFSFLFWLLDNVELLMNGWDVNRSSFWFVFASTTTTAILAWFRKYLRDLQSNIK
jgi:hypothetical protein